MLNISANLESSAVARGLEKVSFHSNPKEGQCQRMFKLSRRLCSFHILVRLCSKSFKLGFNSMWTENFQMYKLGLEKAEEPKIKLPTFARIIDKAREFQKSICFIDYAKAFDFVDHKNLWKSLKEMGIPDHLTCLSKKSVRQVKKQQLEPYMEWLVQNWGKCMTRLYIVILFV